MVLCAYVTWFFVFSIIGWVYECTFCAIKNKEWDNRGFLFGPVCPIYGFGASAAVALYDHFSGSIDASGPWGVFVFCALGSAVLEYATSWALEKHFHARWWDYSNVPLNLNGRVCLPFALCFGAAGTALFYFVAPWVMAVSAPVAMWVWEVLALVLMAVIGADTGITVAALTDFEQRVERAQADFDAVMEVAVTDVVSGRAPLQVDLAERSRAFVSNLSWTQRRSVRHIVRFPERSGSRWNGGRFSGTATRMQEAIAAFEREAHEAAHNAKVATVEAASRAKDATAEAASRAVQVLPSRRDDDSSQAAAGLESVDGGDAAKSADSRFAWPSIGNKISRD